MLVALPSWSSPRLVTDVMKVIAGQPDSATREEIRLHLNQGAGAPEGAAPPPPRGVHLLLLLRLIPGVHLVPVVLLVLRVFLLPGVLPVLLILGVHLLDLVPLPLARELLPITHPLPMMVVTATVTTATILIHLYAVACMVALGALAGLLVVVLREVLGELLDKEIWLGVWVLIWEIVVVVRKVVREALRETLIPRMWVLGGVVALLVEWWPGPSAAPLHTPLEQGCLGLGLVVVPRGGQFGQLVVGVGVELVAPLRALVGLVRLVVVQGPKLVLVGALQLKHICGLSFSFS